MTAGAMDEFRIGNELVEEVKISHSLGQISVESSCKKEINRRLTLERTVMMNLTKIWKSRDVKIKTKTRLVKALVFPVMLYGCEAWTVRK